MSCKHPRVWEAIGLSRIREIFHQPRVLATVRTTLRPSAMTALPTSRSLFRSLLRARAVAFRGDAKALAASRTEIRKHFDVRPIARPPRRPDEAGPAESRAHPVPPPPHPPRQDSAHLSPEDAKKKIEEGVEAESFIRLHVVQAVGNERGNYEMRVEPQHVDGEYEVPGDAPGGCSGTDSKK